MTVTADTAQPPYSLLAVCLGLRGGQFLVADPVLRHPLRQLTAADALEQLGDGAADLLG
jgi:hypothetical protein